MLKLQRVLFVVLIAAAAMAQPRTGTLRGVLTDDSGAVIPAASVTVNGNGAARTAQTQADGSYTVSGLAPGQYTVHVAYPGFAPVDRSVNVGAGGNVQVPIQLSIVAEKQEVTVASEAGPMVSVDPDANTTALVLKGEDLESLPDDPDDLSDALQALAGPGAGPNGGSIYIDGFSGGQLPPKESIREIRINQNPFSAEFDRLGFGRIEILTKPGADKIRGSVSYNDTEGALDSRNPFSTVKPPFSNRMVTANMGGPLGHKVSYFIDFNRRDINNNNIVNAVYLNPSSLLEQNIQTSVLNPNTRTTIAPRLDYQVSKNNTLTGRFEYGWNEYDNQGISGHNLPAPYAEMGYDQTGKQANLMLTDTQIVSSHLVNETRFQYASQYTSYNNTNLLPQINVTGAFTAGGDGYGTYFTTTHHYELQNLSTYSHGAHTIRWGIRVRRNSTLTESEQGFGGTYTFLGEIAPNLVNNQVVTDPSGNPMNVSECATYPQLCTQIQGIQQYQRTLLFQGMGYSPSQIQALGGMPSQFLLQSGNPYGSINVYDAAPWVLDDWRIRPNLTISPGLRYEWQDHISDHRDIAPRLGIAWSPDSRKGTNGKTVIRAGFGIFYDRVNSQLFLNQLLLNGTNQLNYTVPNPLFFQTSPLSAGGWASLAAASGTPLNLGQNSIYFLDPKFRADSMIQSSIGLERQLPHATSASVYFNNTRGLHLAQTVPINSPDPNYGDLRPYGNAGNLFEYESGGTMSQRMLMFNVNTRATANLSLQGNYSYSVANCLESTPSDPYNFSADWGRCSFNHKHRINVVGSYLAPGRIRLSPFIVMQSGGPYDIELGRDLFGDTETNSRPSFASGPGTDVVTTPFGYFNTAPSLTGPFIPYDYMSMPWMISINLRASHTFGFGPPRNAANNMQPGGQGGNGPRGFGGGPGGGGGRAPGGGGPGGGGRAPGGGGRGGFGSSDLTERRFHLIVSVMVTNVLNHDNQGGYVGYPSSPQFGQPTNVFTGFGGAGAGGTQANNRRVELGMRLQF